jgi:AraC-like DNA-binding protein
VLLRQIVELSEPMGIAYERSAGFFKDFHTHSRHMLVCPRGACRMEVRTAARREVFGVDVRRVLWVPKDVVHDDEAISTIYDTMALYPDAQLIEEMIAEADLSDASVTRLQAQVMGLRRSPWLDEILERYFCERVLGTRAPRGSQQILEKQILHEFARLAFETDPASAIESDEDDFPITDDIVSRAVVYIEGNLFEPIDLSRLCEAVATSESTLLRAFKRELEQTPFAYIRNRRLEEAVLLLRAGDHQVRDVAILVGYEDLSAFGKAFRKRYGVGPRNYRGETEG